MLRPALTSTDDFEIGSWALIPKHTPVTRGVVVGCGYGGRDSPDFHLPIPGAAFLFPCFRGLSRSRRWPIFDDPNYHVLHDIDNTDRYILSGGIGALALPWDARIRRAHFNVPSLG